MRAIHEKQPRLLALVGLFQIFRIFGDGLLKFLSQIEFRALPRDDDFVLEVVKRVDGEVGLLLRDGVVMERDKLLRIKAFGERRPHRDRHVNRAVFQLIFQPVIRHVHQRERVVPRKRERGLEQFDFHAQLRRVQVIKTRLERLRGKDERRLGETEADFKFLRQRGQ